MEFYFWNVVVLSQLYGNLQLAEQIGTSSPIQRARPPAISPPSALKPH
jgi:hypothetical protein